MLCLLLLHGFHMILFYQGSLFDLLVLAWARGQFCHWAWKKLHVAAMSFVLSFDSGFAIKETFVEVCECWAKCGLCKSKFAALTSELFSFQSTDPSFSATRFRFVPRRENDRFSHFLASSLVARDLNQPKTFRDSGPVLTGDAGFPKTRPLAPLPGSTSKWEERAPLVVFFFFVDLHGKIHLKTCYQVVDAFFLVSHIAESERISASWHVWIAMFRYVRCELPRPSQKK